jgi:hypothetical protein
VTTLENALAGLLLLVVTHAVCVWFAYDWGWEARQAKVDKDAVASQKETDKKRDEGFVIAAGFEKDLAVLRSKYDKLAKSRRKADALPVNCPASNKIGDVLVPPEFVDSMFNIQGTELK